MGILDKTHKEEIVQSLNGYSWWTHKEEIVQSLKWVFLMKHKEEIIVQVWEHKTKQKRGVNHKSDLYEGKMYV